MANSTSPIPKAQPRALASNNRCVNWPLLFPCYHPQMLLFFFLPSYLPSRSSLCSLLTLLIPYSCTTYACGEPAAKGTTALRPLCGVKDEVCPPRRSSRKQAVRSLLGCNVTQPKHHACQMLGPPQGEGEVHSMCVEINHDLHTHTWDWPTLCMSSAHKNSQQCEHAHQVANFETRPPTLLCRECILASGGWTHAA
eukprot:scaffold136142_cov24-Tisochrysis_lutea.AAC.1